ncbi:MAG: hypothetical protein HY600_05450 [Candidatus Omnitrophica bacterium]|nr:hypothetical protein [Candidatus Omnitrophota bacterium]
MTPRQRWGLAPWVLALAVVSLGAGAQPPKPSDEDEELSAPLAPTPAQIQARLELARDEAQQRAVRAENELADHQEERARLLEHLKRLLVERNRARADVQTLSDTLATITDEGASWRTEAEQRRAEVSELRQQLAAIPAEPPDARKARTIYERELREVREDAEYLWDRQREKLERQQAAARQSFQEQLEALEAARQALAEQLDAITTQAGTTSAALAESERAREAALDDLQRGQALFQKTDLQLQQTAEELDQVTQQAQATEQDLRRRLAAAEQALRQAREDAYRQVTLAETAARQDRVALEQLRSGLMTDWTKLYLRIGVLEAQLGHLAEAERDFQYALQLQPASSAAYYNLGILYDDHLNNGPAAIKAYEQYLLLAPEASDAKTVRGWIQLLKGIEKSTQDRDQWNRPGLPGLAKTFKELWS